MQLTMCLDKNKSAMSALNADLPGSENSKKGSKNNKSVNATFGKNSNANR